MFTLIPSLYFIGIQYYRYWNGLDRQEIKSHRKKSVKDIPIVPIRQEQISLPSVNVQEQENADYVSRSTDDESQKSRSSKRDSHRRHRRRRPPITSAQLTDDDIHYLINETGFTADEIANWHKGFLNDCPDGKLSKETFTSIYQKFYRKGRVEKFCRHAFQLFDKDRSGYMDFVEFLIAVSLTSSEDPVRKIDLFFKMYDIDHNHRIDVNEMRLFIEAIYDLMGIDISDPTRIDTKVNDIFSKAECDQLGYLKKDQFSNACKNDHHIRKLLIPKTTGKKP